MSRDFLGIDLPTPPKPDFGFFQICAKALWWKATTETTPHFILFWFPAKGLFQFLGLDILHVFVHTQCSHIPAQFESLGVKTEWPKESPSRNKFNWWFWYRLCFFWLVAATFCLPLAWLNDASEGFICSRAGEDKKGFSYPMFWFKLLHVQWISKSSFFSFIFCN